MTLRCIDWKQVLAQKPNPLQQVELNRKGLVIDKPLNVQVVLIDQSWSLQAASQRVHKSHYAQVSAQLLM